MKVDAIILKADIELARCRALRAYQRYAIASRRQVIPMPPRRKQAVDACRYDIGLTFSLFSGTAYFAARLRLTARQAIDAKGLFLDAMRIFLA